MRLPRLTAAHATGILDKVVGLNREIAGEIFDNAELKKAGQLQQEKGTAKLNALQAEARAETEKAKVESLDKTEKKVASNA